MNHERHGIHRKNPQITQMGADFNLTEFSYISNECSRWQKVSAPRKVVGFDHFKSVEFDGFKDSNHGEYATIGLEEK